MTKRKLTSKQLTIFEYIEQYVIEYRRSPLIREVQLGCQVASYKSVIDRLNALERKGFIRRTPNKHRGIRLGRYVPQEREAMSSGLALKDQD